MCAKIFTPNDVELSLGFSDSPMRSFHAEQFLVLLVRAWQEAGNEWTVSSNPDMKRLLKQICMIDCVSMSDLYDDVNDVFQPSERILAFLRTYDRRSPDIQARVARCKEARRQRLAELGETANYRTREALHNIGKASSIDELVRLYGDDEGNLISIYALHKVKVKILWPEDCRKEFVWDLPEQNQLSWLKDMLVQLVNSVRIETGLKESGYFKGLTDDPARDRRVLEWLCDCANS